jgi:transcriptional regulator with XRE-family HTH domain/DNA-binding protein H-NS
MGLKTHEMAEKLGTSPSVISGIENAKRTPSRNILMALYALDEDVDMDWLILGTSKRGKLRKDFAMREAENKALQQRNMEKEEENLRLLAKINALQSAAGEVEALKARIAELTAEKLKTRERKRSQKNLSPADTEEIAGLNNSIRVLRDALKGREKDREEIAGLNEKIQQQSRKIRQIAELEQEIKAKDAKIKELEELISEQAVKPSALLISEYADPADEKAEDGGPAGSAEGAKHGGPHKTRKEAGQVHP